MPHPPKQWLNGAGRSATIMLLASFCLPPALRAQTQSSPATGATSPNTQVPAQPAASPKPATTAKPKRVITNDELEPHAAAGAVPANGKTPTAEAASFVTCDSACEQDARDQLGYGLDVEAEWRAQIVEARRDLASDAEWRGMLFQAIRQTDSYCKFQLQQSRQVSSNRGDFRSRVQSAKNAQYFENMDRALQQQLQAAASRMQGRIEEVQILSSVRAALMTVQANRIFNRACTGAEPR